MERQNNTREFISSFIKKDGFPIWHKARIETHKKKNKNNPTSNFDGEGLTDTTVYIPLVVNEEQYVHGFIKAIVADTVDLQIFRQNDYINFPFQPTISSNVTTAENFALRMMLMDKEVFGSTEFKIEDKRMFHNSTNYADTGNIQRFITLNNPSGEGFANGTTINNYTYELCYTVVTYTNNCNSFSAPGTNNQQQCFTPSYYNICITYEVGEGNEGGGGGSWPFQPGGGGGNPPGGGGGPPCEAFGTGIINGVVPIECEPEPVGNPWPPTNPQSWLDDVWMTYNLKDSTNNPCVASVLSTLKSLGTKLPELLRSVFDTTGTNGFDVTFKLDYMYTYGGGGSTEPNITNFDYKSKINSYFDNATDLSVATTIIHEIFHCQIFAWYRKAVLLNDTALQNNLARKYGYLFTLEYANLDSNFIAIVNGSEVMQHQDIAVRYRNIIGQAVYQFALAKGINVTETYCKDLAWSGLQGSRAFLQEVNPTNQGLIDDIIKAEKDPYGATINGNNFPYKGNPCL